MIILKVGLAILPTVVLIIIVLRIDRYNVEPAPLLRRIFLFGVLAAVPAIIVEGALKNLIFFGGIMALLFENFIVIALTEEFFKRRAVLPRVMNEEAFDERLDGIVYCVMASLGFATIENIMYVISYWSSDPYLWISRGLLSVPAHMMFGVIMGYYLSRAKFCTNPKLQKSYMARSLWIPVLFHGIYDFIILSQIQILLILFIPFVIFMWIYSIRKIREYRRESRQAHMYSNR